MKTRMDAWALLLRATGWCEYVCGEGDERIIGWLPPDQHDGTQTQIIDLRLRATMPEEVVPIDVATQRLYDGNFGDLAVPHPLVFQIVAGTDSEGREVMRTALTMVEFNMLLVRDYEWDAPLAVIHAAFVQWVDHSRQQIPVHPVIEVDDIPEVIEDAEPEDPINRASPLHDQLRFGWPIVLRLESDATTLAGMFLGMREAVTDAIAILRENAPDSRDRALARLGQA